MSWIKHTYRAELIVFFLILVALPVQAIDQVSCGKSEDNGEALGIGLSGLGQAIVDCASSPSKIWLYSYDLAWGSHWAIGRINKDFETSEAGTYRIYIKGDAFGSLSLSTPTGIPGIDPADGTAAIDVYARVYEKDGRETMPYGGNEVSILSREIDDWGEKVLSGETFQHYFDVDLKANSQYVVELKAKASTSSSGAESSMSKFGPKRKILPDDTSGLGVTWLACDITLPKTAAQEEQEVIFPDPNLEAAIRAAINKPEGSIYAGDLEGLKRLDAPEKGIKDIAGLEYCTNLEYLNLGGSRITDVSPLSGLIKLEILSLSRNRITDVSSLSGLTELTQLGLSCNQITDVSSLSRLTKLVWLDLGANPITDVSSLSGLTNAKIALGTSGVADLDPRLEYRGSC